VLPSLRRRPRCFVISLREFSQAIDRFHHRDTEVTEEKMDEFFVCSGNTGTNKKLSALQTIDWPKAGRFIENRHLPILDKKI